jgi:hypothetical protein
MDARARDTYNDARDARGAHTAPHARAHDGDAHDAHSAPHSWPRDTYARRALDVRDADGRARWPADDISRGDTVRDERGLDAYDDDAHDDDARARWRASDFRAESTRSHARDALDGGHTRSHARDDIDYTRDVGYAREHTRHGACSAVDARDGTATWEQVAKINKNVFPQGVPITKPPHDAVLTEAVASISKDLLDHARLRGPEARQIAEAHFRALPRWLDDPRDARALDGRATHDPWLMAMLMQFALMLKSLPEGGAARAALSIAERDDGSHALSFAHVQRAVDLERKSNAMQIRREHIYATIQGGIRAADNQDYIRQLYAHVRLFTNLGGTITPQEVVYAFIAHSPEQDTMPYALQAVNNAANGVTTLAEAYAIIDEIHRATVSRQATATGVARSRAQTARASTRPRALPTPRPAGTAIALIAGPPPPRPSDNGRGGGSGMLLTVADGGRGRGRGGFARGAAIAARGAGSRAQPQCLVCGEPHRWQHCTVLPAHVIELVKKGEYHVEHAWRDGLLAKLGPQLERRLLESLPAQWHPPARPGATLARPQTALPAVTRVGDAQPSGVWRAHSHADAHADTAAHAYAARQHNAHLHASPYDEDLASLFGSASLADGAGFAGVVIAIPRDAGDGDGGGAEHIRARCGLNDDDGGMVRILITEDDDDDLDDGHHADDDEHCGVCVEACADASRPTVLHARNALPHRSDKVLLDTGATVTIVRDLDRLQAEGVTACEVLLEGIAAATAQRRGTIAITVGSAVAYLSALELSAVPYDLISESALSNALPPGSSLAWLRDRLVIDTGREQAWFLKELLGGASAASSTSSRRASLATELAHYLAA